MRNSSRNIRIGIYELIAAAMSIGLVVINIIRSVLVPITVDETGYAPDTSYKKLWLNEMGSANDHMLHSLLRKFFVEHFSTHVFFYRVDSILAQIIFLLFSYQLCRLLFKNKVWALFSFCILNVASPLIFDFWGLSRGYGLALTFMTVSIYCYIKYIEGKRLPFLALALAGAILSVDSNLAYINYYVALTSAVMLQSLLFKDEHGNRALLKPFFAILIAAIMLAAVIYIPLRNVMGHDELSYLGSEGFVENTVKSLVETGFFLAGPGNQQAREVVQACVIAIAILLSAYWGVIYFRRRYYKGYVPLDVQYGLILYILLVTPVVSLIAQHAFLGINYLTDRTALFFIFLFVLLLVYSLYHISRHAPRLGWAAFIFLFILTGYNFCSKVNLRYSYLWWFNVDDLHVMQRIIDESPDMKRKIKVRVDWRFVACLNYDFTYYHPGKFEKLYDKRDEPGTDTTFDFYYIDNNQDVTTLKNHYVRDTSFVYGAFILYKKRR